MSTSAAAPSSCDLLVIGSGAGALSTAVTAAHLGLSVVVAEKENLLGGTTAWSGGWMWIPRNPLAVAAGIEEPLEAPLAYLRHELGERFEEGRLRTFLRHGPHMVSFFRRRTALDFIDGNGIPDFHGRNPHAARGGRSVCAAPFEGERLGPLIKQLRAPLEETTLWGMGIAAGADLRHFIESRHSLTSLWHVIRRLLRHLPGRLRHGRGTWLVNGNALVAGLLRSAADRGVQLKTGHCALRLLKTEGRITGAVFGHAGDEVTVHARRGVVLATGGFPHDPERLRQWVAHAPTGTEHWSAGAPGNTGDGLRMAEALGAAMQGDWLQPVALAPVSRVTRRDGSVAHFPHLIERAKPGLIAVRANGRRFANEADSYHDMMQALLAATRPGEVPEAWLICDQAFIRRYGLGAVKPAPLPLGPWQKTGYLHSAPSLPELARQCGIDPEALAQTVARYNAQVPTGVDPDFQKGETDYNRIQGDALHARRHGWPNPCMGPVEQAPFHAVRLVMGSLGTFAGLHTNAEGQVLDAAGQPLPGLYAAGNDMGSVMRGHYPSGGITLGPAMTFGYLAAHHAAGVSPEKTPLMDT